MKTGPPRRVSKKAMVAIDRISRILEKISAEEHRSVLKQAKEKAERALGFKALGSLAKLYTRL